MDVLALLGGDIAVNDIRHDTLRPEVLPAVRRQVASHQEFRTCGLLGSHEGRLWLEFSDAAEHHVAAMNRHAVDDHVGEFTAPKESGLHLAGPDTVRDS